VGCGENKFTTNLKFAGDSADIGIIAHDQSLFG
jgi:hypothetical protein